METNYKARIAVFVGASFLALFQQFLMPTHKSSLGVKKYGFILLVSVLLVLFEFFPRTIVSVHIILLIIIALEILRLSLPKWWIFCYILLLATAGWSVLHLNSNVVVEAFLLTAIFDGFSETMGKAYGKRKVVPHISPNKTWAGLWGGSLATLAAGAILKTTTNALSFVMLFSVPILAFVGDLWASRMKRKAGIKDASAWLPGQGGFLDRFDGYIAVLIGMYILHNLKF